MVRSRSKWVMAAVPAVIAVALSALGLSSPHSGASSLAGSAGTDVSLPATPSVKTVSGRDAFAGLKVTVNQTANLVNQAVSVTWTGGTPTYTDAASGYFSGRFGGDYLQIFQCWGDDDGTTPSNPGPPPQQCEFGGENANQGAYPVRSVTFPYERIISSPAWSCGPTAPPGCLSYADEKKLAASDPTQAYVDPTGYILSPFRAVDGTLVPASVNYNYANQIPYDKHDINPFFSYNDTNELDFSRTYPNGTGQDLFRVDTGEEAPGLGCGQKSQKHADGSLTVPRCWLVIVPRGTGAQENLTGDATPGDVDTSPLTPTAWRNRISVPLEFNPVGVSCSLSTSVRRVVGSELAAPAVANWQPVLCAGANASPLSYSALPDDRARSLLFASGLSAAGMGVMSRPVDPATVDQAKPILYAPLTLSGVTIGFNIQRVSKLGSDGQLLPDEAPIAGRRVSTLHLTPRLVAKLLTQSYLSQLYPGVVPTAPGYSWAAHNPHTIAEDPEFIAFNPEFAELRSAQGVDSSGLVVEQQSSDAAYELWRWILADPEAKSWLDGRPDDSAMRVNPYYSTNPRNTPSGIAFASTPPSGFAKSDPYCWTAPSNYLVGNPPQAPRQLCAQDWAPYVLSMRDAAATTRSSNTGAKTTFDPGATAPSTAWTSNGPQTIGSNWIMSVTDTAQAARFGLQTAMLSRSGDDTPSRTFVAPDTSGITAGANAMTDTTVAGFREANPKSAVTGAYPLPMLTYAATVPASLDASARRDYGALLTYAASKGQQPGTAFGQLPPGYVSLPASLAKQTATAAQSLLHPAPPSAPAGPSAPPPDRAATALGSDSTGDAMSTLANSGAQTPGSASSDAPASVSPAFSAGDIGSQLSSSAPNRRPAPPEPAHQLGGDVMSPAPGSGAALAAPGSLASGQPVLSAARTPGIAIRPIVLLIPLGLLVALAALGGALGLGSAARGRVGDGPRS